MYGQKGATRFKRRATNPKLPRRHESNTYHGHLRYFRWGHSQQNWDHGLVSQRLYCFYSCFIGCCSFLPDTDFWTIIDIHWAQVNVQISFKAFYTAFLVNRQGILKMYRLLKYARPRAQTLNPQIFAARYQSQVIARSESTARYIRLTRTPCRLIYVKPCRCWKFQNHTKLYTGDENIIKGSLDPLFDESHDKLYEQVLEIGEVATSSDGLLHPESACQCYKVSVACLSWHWQSQASEIQSQWSNSFDSTCWQTNTSTNAW